MKCQSECKDNLNIIKPNITQPDSAQQSNVNISIKITRPDGIIRNYQEGSDITGTSGSLPVFNYILPLSSDDGEPIKGTYKVEYSFTVGSAVAVVHTKSFDYQYSKIKLSLVEDINEKPVCLQVELGHISLPSSVKEALNKRIGSSNFITVEDLFSGKGLSDLYKVVAEGKVKSGEDISKAHIEKTDQHATQTLELFSEMLGLMTRELIVQYLPFGGIYFAGSVSRAVFNAKLTSKFENGSSNNSNSGCGAKALANATRCCSPPDNSCGMTVFLSIKPICSRRYKDRVSDSDRDKPCKPNFTFSITFI